MSGTPEGAARRGAPRPGRRAPSRLKAVGLISGGLDSELAARLLKEQGVEVVGLNFSTGFCKVDHRRALRRRKDRDPRKLRNAALHAAASAGVPVEIVDVSEEYLEVVTNPRHGYGAAANPCIDCRIFMLRKAKEHADRIGAEVVFTGEVLGQRPMSQHGRALRLIESEAGLEGRLLRPLSARFLPETEAERRGDIRREALGRITGRSRKEQIRLAAAFGLSDHAQPGGGCCYLADRNYARRFRDLLAHRPRGSITRDDIIMLKVGRHYRLSPEAKAIVGREEAENAFLERQARGRWLLEAAAGSGPTTLLDGRPRPSDVETAARITARYADRREGAEVTIRARREGEEIWPLVTPAAEEELSSMRL